LFISRGFVLESFRPAWGLASNHAQTVAGAFLRHTDGIAFRRVRLTTPDGDFLDLDFAEQPAMAWPPATREAPSADHTPWVLLLHGLEGSARRGYACEMYRQLGRLGIRAVGLNYRSCSGEMNRTARLYHAGATEDVAFVRQWLAERYPQAARGMVGFSLGANLLLKYLGEQGESLPAQLQAAVAVSPPFDLARNARVVEGGLAYYYARRLLRPLQVKAQAKAALLDGAIDLARVAAAQTVREFDEAFTAPLYGFRDAADYYARCSCGPYLGAISAPTLLIRALDDPLFDPDDVPQAAIAANPHLYAGLTRRGGHVGFVAQAASARPGRYSWWAERQAARFLADQLKRET
jgi:predicted alpha/beta-fold hydrolase